MKEVKEKCVPHSSLFHPPTHIPSLTSSLFVTVTCEYFLRCCNILKIIQFYCSAFISFVNYRQYADEGNTYLHG